MRRFYSTPFWQDNRGAVAYLVGVLIALLTVTTGIAVDIGRVYSVETAAQQALDAATIGSVVTAGQTDVTQEFEDLFGTNYRMGYMGSSLESLTITETSSGSGVYQSVALLNVPRTLTRILGMDAITVEVRSQVNRGFTEGRKKLAVSLVLDNSSSMTNSDMDALEDGAVSLSEIIANYKNNMENVTITVVPFDVGVRIGNGQSSWIQNDWVNPHRRTMSICLDVGILICFPLSVNHPGFKGVVANRNNDSPRNGFNDFTDQPPLQAQYKFRLPSEVPSYYGCIDKSDLNLEEMLFAEDKLSRVKQTLRRMEPTGCTRLNVGLFWGWMALSEKWQGVWDQSRPTLPLTPSKDIYRAIVLFADGTNNVYTVNNSNFSNDDESFDKMCSEVRLQGINIYTIAYGSEANASQLLKCSGSNSKSFVANSRTSLIQVFEQIGDDLLYNSIGQ